MNLHFGARVICADGTDLGRLRELAVHPQTHFVTHLIVQKGLFNATATVIPAVAVAESSRTEIHLALTATQLAGFRQPHRDADFTPAGATAVVQAAPEVKLPELPSSMIPPGFQPDVMTAPTPVDFDEAILEPGAPVSTADGHNAGRVHEVMTLPDGRISSFHVKGPLFQRPHIIPAQWIAGLDDNRIVLTLTAAELAERPELNE